MPRPALKNVSTAALQAEIQRRVAKLDGLLRLRDDVDKQIADLKALAAQFVAAAPAALAVKAGRKRGRKAKAVAKRQGKASPYGQTGNGFILGLFAGGKTLTSQQIQAAWTDAGRKGKVSKSLAGLVDEKKLARRKIRGHKGYNYKAA